MKRLTWSTLALAFAALLPVPSTFAVDLDSLLVKSIGGSAAFETVKNMRSFRAVGDVEMNGQTGRFTEIIVPPNKIYLEISFQQFNIVQAFDGVTAWQQDLNGKIADLSGFERQELLRSAYFETYSFVLPDRMPGVREMANDTVIDGRGYYQVNFRPGGTGAITVLFDKETGLRYVSLSNLDNIATVTSTENYHEISHVQVSFGSHATAPNTPITLLFATDTAEFNVPVDSTIFSKPDGRMQDFHFPSDQTSVDIPFKYVRGHIYLKGNINGKMKARFILDSGASASIFHAGTIKYLNLPVVGTMPARGVAGFEEAKLVKTDSINIGPLALYNQIGGSIDLSILGNPEGEGMAFGGVLGYDFLSRFPILINYFTSTLTVFNPETFVPPDSGHEIPFDLTMQVPTVDVQVAGEEGKFIVDLGNAFDLILHEQFVTLHQLESKLSFSETTSRGMGGIGGDVMSKTAIAPEVKMGDLTLKDVPVTLSGSSSGISGSSEISGNIGNELLQRFSVLFDYHQRRIILYPIVQ